MINARAEIRVALLGIWVQGGVVLSASVWVLVENQIVEAEIFHSNALVSNATFQSSNGLSVVG